MLSKDEAQSQMSVALPEVSLKAWTLYGDLYLFRVQFPMPGEENYDPFFSVDANTGDVNEFSVLSDGDPNEIGALQWQDI